MDKAEQMEYIGQVLLNKGFETWFKYMFKAIEQTKFIVEPIHPELFETFQSIYDLEKIRLNINLPPRSAKTTLLKYFLVFCITKNPKCNFIYTSYSQTLLNTIAGEIRDILESHVYKAMYPQRFTIESEEVSPIDDFWADYLSEQTKGKRNTYSSHKIITYMGGTCLFASVGAQITGMGAGQRTSKLFSGALLIDDANKPADTRSEVMRQKVLRYFEETLLSRLNNPKVPIINVQQRLHVEDLTGLLIKNYHFDTLVKPLLDENGVCQIPSQYTEQRIKEIQTNNYMFLAQYQQQPIVLGGQVIKRDWFGYYPVKWYPYKRVLIAADTAMKVKEHNDYSVFLVGGVTQDNKLHILEMVRGKWEAPELEKVAVNIWNKYKRDEMTGSLCNGLYIEDKASGTGLIQGLKSKYGMPVIPIQVSKDKLQRVEDILTYIQSGMVLLPESETYGNNPDLLAECEAFTRDDSHLHDDIVDGLCHLIKSSIAQTTVSLLDFFKDDVI